MFVFIDLYGKCAQVTLTTDNCAQEARILSNDLTNEATAAASAHNHVNQISSDGHQTFRAAAPLVQIWCSSTFAEKTL